MRYLKRLARRYPMQTFLFLFNAGVFTWLQTTGTMIEMCIRDSIKTIQDLLPFSKDYNLLIVGLIAVTIVITALIAFLNTRLGQAYIATGDNRDMAKSFGINTDNMEVMGLVISNGIIALSGALISQQDGYADVSKGIGVIVIGLASIIIGEVLYATNLTLLERLIAICICLLYTSRCV